MKKKVKLITTIASLCLAVALMAFGVYAALNVTYSITNTVSYSAAPNVKATIKYTTELENATATVGTEKTPYQTVSNKTIFTDSIGNIKQDGEVVEDYTGTEEIGDLTLTAIDLSENMKFRYTVTITNNVLEADAHQTLYVKLTLPANNSTLDANGYKVTVTGQELSTVARGANVQYTVEIEVSTSTTITKVDLGSAIALQMTPFTGA